MVLNPSVQEKAQEQIDEFYGPSVHIPSFTDFEGLPYVTAIVLEVLRFCSGLPNGSFSPLRESQNDKAFV